MKPITLEEIDKKKKNIVQSLDQLNLEKRKVERAEKEMFELHRQSLKPLRQILETINRTGVEKVIWSKWY